MTPNLTLQEMMAISAMLTTLEKIVGAGWLPMEEEMSVRLMLPRVQKIFGFDTVAERDDSNIVKLSERMQ